MKPIDEHIEEAIKVVHDDCGNGELLRLVLISMYAKGIGAAMRAMGHWPSDTDEQVQP